MAIDLQRRKMRKTCANCGHRRTLHGLMYMMKTDQFCIGWDGTRMCKCTEWRDDDGAENANRREGQKV
jgi:hypothetical protein